ncbi:MAG: aminoacyl-tRNA hydrolase [Patescibacteria group bacterium]|nr:aminoacyl-tRNA hydrolase [Patescibacteria group bacterium]MDD4304789.1 aminoacyl-tRNA hydrolase [Patescibacteria group bacterium]MDD4695274.1 aminoacyl-tRNA hydrolase [Patescibacteria group bacterium]
MKLIIGLGNPGKQYENTKHNCGFLVVEKFATELETIFTENKKLKSQIAKIGDIIIAKPTTWMNESGDAVSLLKEYYKIDTKDIVIINDDLDIEMGKIKIGIFESSAGHNGIKSITGNLKSTEFARIRVGIKNETIKNIPSEDIVLQKFFDDEKQKVNIAIDNSIEALKLCLENKMTEAMNKYN